jgi:hypothetical protein
MVSVTSGKSADAPAAPLSEKLTADNDDLAGARSQLRAVATADSDDDVDGDSESEDGGGK